MKHLLKWVLAVPLLAGAGLQSAHAATIRHDNVDYEVADAVYADDNERELADMIIKNEYMDVQTKQQLLDRLPDMSNMEKLNFLLQMAGQIAATQALEK